MELWKNLLYHSDPITDSSETLSINLLLSLYLKGNLELDVSLEPPHYVVNIDGNEELYSKLLDCYYQSAASTKLFLSKIQKDEGFESVDIKKLKLVFDLNDFFENFSHGVVASYHFLQSNKPEVNRLVDLIKCATEDWEIIVSAIALNYGAQIGKEAPGALPASFAGTNLNLKKTIYIRKLAEQIKTWFPQAALLWELQNIFENEEIAEWNSVLETLQSEEWELFDLSNTDVYEFIQKNNLTIELEKVLELQRLFHLTSDAKSIATLIQNNLTSSYQISQMEEDEFTALYGDGFKTAQDARTIHRIASNYIAEAAFNIQAYATDTKSDVEIAAVPKSISSRSFLSSSTAVEDSNISKIRTISRGAPNWPGLFGKVNYNKATEGQSILSASAYFIDLLKFLKVGPAYNAFVKRRPDYLTLELTKSNAEIAVPTIDLVIELLENILTDKETDEDFISANTPSGLTETQLRAEPILNSTGAKFAYEYLANTIYPFQSSVNIARICAQKILSNLSLHFSSLVEVLMPAAPYRELLLSSQEFELLEGISAIPVYEQWGLKNNGNKVLFPDKNSEIEGSYIDVLRQVAILLQRSNLSFVELQNILKHPVFNRFKVKAKTAEDFQLANINGYELVKIDETEDWALFFANLSKLIRRKNLLNWSIEELLLTWDYSVASLDVIQELILQYKISVQDAVVLGGETQLSREVLSALYQSSQLLPTEELEQKTFSQLATTAFDITFEEFAFIYNILDFDSFEQIKRFQEFYRVVLFSKTFGITFENIKILKNAGIYSFNEQLLSLRKFCDEWRLITGTSIEPEFYLNLLSPIEDSLKEKSLAFAEKIKPFYSDNNENQENSENVNGTENQDDQDAAEAENAEEESDNNKPVNENLTSLVISEFGLWEYSESFFNFKIWEDLFEQNKPIDEFIAAYASLYRKVQLYNYLQVIGLNLDLNKIVFVTYEENEFKFLSYEDLRDIIQKIYAADRFGSSLNIYEDKDDNEENEKIKISSMAKELSIEENVFECIRNFALKFRESSFDENYVFARCYELYSKIHLCPDDLVKLCTWAPYDEFAQSVEVLHNAVKTNLKQTEWLKFAQEMNDALRTQKRDALVALVCYESSLETEVLKYPQKFTDANDIYAYYLIDVKMEADMAISRIVMANTSIQLFVQRALLGLEGENLLTPKQTAEWEWMKNYRVWEAARKVFLYPENWITSDLRDDKSPFFNELQERLFEFSSSHEYFEKALFEYLEKIREISSIEIVGACKEDGGDEGGILYTLHIVGRTQGEPHKFYYRRYKAKAIYSGEWTPWEKLDVDIPAETVTPVLVNGRLYITWPQITLGERNAEACSDGGVSSIEYYARVQICWTSYNGTQWSRTRISKNVLLDTSTDPLDFTLAENELIEDRYHFKALSSSESFIVKIIKTTYSYTEYEHELGRVDLTDELSKIKKVLRRDYDYQNQFFTKLASFTVHTDGRDELNFEENPRKLQVELFSPERTQLVHGVFVENQKFTCGNKTFSYPKENKIFGYSPARFKIVSTNLSMLPVDDEEVEDLPFFYMDGRRTFFVQSVPKDEATATQGKSYKFELLSHTLVDDFYKRFREGGLKWLYTRETQALPISDSYYYSYSYYNYYFSVYLGYYLAGDWQSWDLGQTIFRHNYAPKNSCVEKPYPAPMVDFVWGGANSIYNWELFFYVPMLIAEKAIAEQNFEEALLWLELVFDPKEGFSAYERTKRFISDLPKGSKYWKFLPFFANKDADKSILEMLGMPTARDRLPDKTALNSLVDKWKNAPFNPHLVARYRLVAYQKYVLMRYLDTLIGWGDQLFKEDTTESVNLAVQFYILAAEILGPQNAEVFDERDASPKMAKQILDNSNELGNAFIAYENSALIGRDKIKTYNARALDPKAKRTERIVESMFYFTVPRNDILFGYWDKVSDRLFKIRNSLNIQGVKRILSLFAPPIDPALLVKAKAKGISVDTFIKTNAQDETVFRFKVVVKLAKEIARDARDLGHELLNILEKKDAEALSLFNAKCSKQLLAEDSSVRKLKTQTLETAKIQLETRKQQKEESLKQKKTVHKVSTAEKKYQEVMEKVAKIQETIENFRNLASVTFKIPDFKYGSIINAFGGPSFDMESLGGTKLAENLVSAAESYAARFVQKQLDAAKTKLQSEWERRTQEWEIEDLVEDAEIDAIEKEQIINDIQIQEEEKRQTNLAKEIAYSDEFYELLSDKFTNQELYIWLEKEAASTFSKMLDVAVQMKRIAKACYKKEIGKDFDKPLENDYWDNLHKGLLAPEKLLLSLHQLELSYIQNSTHLVISTKTIEITENMLANKQNSNELAVDLPIDNFDLNNKNFLKGVLQAIPLNILDVACLNAEVEIFEYDATAPESNESSLSYPMECVTSKKFEPIKNDALGDRYFPLEGIPLDKIKFKLVLKEPLNLSEFKILLHITYTINNGG